VILLVVFVFGLPALLVFIMVKYRHRLMESPLQRTIGFIYMPFKKKLFYFGYVQIGRSLLLSIFIGILPESSTFRRLLILISLLSFLVAQIHLWPYIHESDNYLETASLMCLIITYAAGLSFGSLPLSPDTIATSVFVITLNALFVCVLVIILGRRFMHMARDMISQRPIAHKSNIVSRSISLILQLNANAVSPEAVESSTASACSSPEASEPPSPFDSSPGTPTPLFHKPLSQRKHASNDQLPESKRGGNRGLISLSEGLENSAELQVRDEKRSGTPPARSQEQM